MDTFCVANTVQQAKQPNYPAEGQVPSPSLIAFLEDFWQHAAPGHHEYGEHYWPMRCLCPGRQACASLLSRA
eukprot:1159994-Pelagomonas_calceolata.AAC.9